MQLIKILLITLFLLPSFTYSLNLGNFEESETKLSSVFFATDKAVIRISEEDTLINTAETIKAKKLKVIIIGNADERGDQPYNISLGSRRALSVAMKLLDLGVDQSQIVLVSYGEEKPISKTLKENRRVDVIAIEPSTKIVKENRLNRITLYGGGGPNGLKNLELTATIAIFKQYYGPVMGLGYSRLVTDTLSIGIVGFSNKSGFLNIGLDF